jgi:radical SAM protein with 4Fe4S-binding SPASM domain
MTDGNKLRKLPLDSHKLQFHPRAVADFLEGKEIIPLYAEISPVAYCNHHCIFCNFNYLGHKGRFPAGRMSTLVEELADAGLKSIVFAGSGEPSMHPDTFPAIIKAKALGLDVAMSTNGALLREEHLGDIAKSLTWIRFSISGGTPEKYAKIHRTKEEDFHVVINNMRKLKAIKDKTKSQITIGTQTLLISDIKDDVISHALFMKECGADYFVIKHFCENDTNVFNIDVSFRTVEFMNKLKEDAEKLSDGDFQIIVRDESYLYRKREYNVCYGLPFIIYFAEDCEVYSCFSHIYDKNTSLGSIRDQSFIELWKSETKRKALEYIDNKIDKDKCQANCRHHRINEYLWDLKHNQPEHINFI